VNSLARHIFAEEREVLPTVDLKRARKEKYFEQRERWGDELSTLVIPRLGKEEEKKWGDCKQTLAEDEKNTRPGRKYRWAGKN